jgi:hypothetical protein
MAIRYAVANGNWSNTATWNGGTLPTSADDVFANGFVVTINQNVTVLSLSTRSTTGVNSGGRFEITAGNYNIVCDTISGGGTVACLYFLGYSGILNITANTIQAFEATAIQLANNANCTIVINGNIVASTTTTTLGLQTNGGNLTLTINGNITSNVGRGMLLSLATGTININGFALSSGTQVGFVSNSNSSLITANIQKAISIDSGLAGVESFQKLTNIFVKEIEQGNFGYVPISGYIRLSTASGAFYKGVTTGSSTRTLSDPADIAGQVPAQSDVRFGVTYQSGSKTGSAYIPAAASVGFGVPVDNTTGTAALTPASVWDAATSSLTTSGSIGERLKNASTVDTTGDQLAALL